MIVLMLSLVLVLPLNPFIPISQTSADPGEKSDSVKQLEMNDDAHCAWREHRAPCDDVLPCGGLGEDICKLILFIRCSQYAGQSLEMDEASQTWR
jgi:hypothetical protein